jgi:hypothetical protein
MRDKQEIKSQVETLVRGFLQSVKDVFPQLKTTSIA